MKKNTTLYRASAARGFSLVELMVALLIGLIISIGVVQIFSASRATYQLDESLARAQENGRFALEFLTQDIRHAGYLGCNRDTTQPPPFNFLANATGQPQIFQGVFAFEFTGTGIGNTFSPTATPANVTTGWNLSPITTFVPNTSIPLVPISGALRGTDVIVVQRMAPNAWRLVPPYITPNLVFIDPVFANNVQANDVLMVADCQQAAIFMVTGINAAGVITHTAGPATNRCGAWASGINIAAGNTGTAACTDPFNNPVPGTALGTIETVVFFVANDPTSGRPTLFRNMIRPSGASVGGGAQALVEGVENFQVLYGVDDSPFDGVADRYTPANGVVDFRRVVSVQIGILVYGVNATGTVNDTELDTDIHTIAGTNIDPPDDRRKRRVFNTTIQLRNRGM